MEESKQWFNQLIRKVGKPLKALLIILLSSVSSYGQLLTPSDSANFKRDFEALLKKYNLQGKGYLLNVQSNHQNGGQTAFIINNNNYYGDSTLSETNFGYYLDTLEQNKIAVYVYPKKGSWITPYIGIDTLDLNAHKGIQYDPGSGSIRIYENIHFVFDGKPHGIAWIVRDGACSKNDPMKVIVTDKNAFFTFGDVGDDNKNYFFSNGVATCLPPIIHNK